MYEPRTNSSAIIIRGRAASLQRGSDGGRLDARLATVYCGRQGGGYAPKRGSSVNKLERTVLEYWSLLAGIASALAIMVSVIHLALQIHDNTRLLRSQAHSNALVVGQRPIELMVANQGLARIMQEFANQAGQPTR